MPNERISDIVRETNALALGWHIGFYYFVLAIAAKGETDSLQAEEEDVLDVAKSRINELTRYFNIDTEWPFPKSPAEARALFASIGREERSTLGSSFDDILATHYGREIATLYDLGKTLMTYSLIARRGEAEVKPEIASLAETIRTNSKALRIPLPLVEEYLSHPEELADPTVVDRIAEARKRESGQPHIQERLSSPWATGSFYLSALVTIGVLFLVIAKTVSPVALPIVLIASMLAISIIGALQLRNDTRLSERNFLELMGLAVRSLPFLRHSRQGAEDTTTRAKKRRAR